MLTEISNLRGHHVFSELPRSQVPRGARIVDTTWTFKSKSDQQGRLDRAKARIVARGFRQQAGIDHSGDVYSPVTSIVVWRAVVAEAARRHMRCLIVDIKSAYLMTPLTGAVYVTPPPGYSDLMENGKPGALQKAGHTVNPNKYQGGLKGYQGDQQVIWRLHRFLYGLALSGRAFNAQFTRHLLEMGMKQSESEPCLFTYRGSNQELIFLFRYSTFHTPNYIPEFSIEWQNEQKIGLNHFFKRQLLFPLGL